MNSLIQKILIGFNNRQIINVLNSGCSVDILPKDLDSILNYFTEADGRNTEDLAPIIPDLNSKNQINGVGPDQFKLISDDIVAFQDIEEALRHNRNGALRQKYKNAIKLLNIQYTAKFQGRFPEFVVQAATAHREKSNCDDIMTIKFIGLMHYMYSVCDIGIRP